jgi:hypothetical protein
VFSYNKRAVWFRKQPSGNKGNFIYTFRDDSRKAELVGNFVEKADKDYGEEEYHPMDVLKEIRMGYFSFCSNLDVPAKEIYLSYKQRWDIEQCFDYLKNSVSTAASYAHSDDYFRGWLHSAVPGGRSCVLRTAAGRRQNGRLAAQTAA